VRGVPLITLLFVSNIILPIFLPPDVALDSVIRVIVMVTAFASAYMAEVIRGGLQAIPKGQYEAAQAMGLGYWQMMRLIILPQALKISIPGIVNTFIGLFKDTTLVIIIGLFDILGIANAMVSNPDWLGLSSETYFVVALFFFTVCFSMSRYSIHLERKLDTTKR
jgi:general L-amino acid transport system permease protein